MAFRLLTSRIRSRLLQALSPPSPSPHRPHHLLASSNVQSLPSIPCPLPNLQSPLFHLRRLSTLRRPPTTRSSRVDIGVRARQLQNRRLWTYALTFGGIAGFIVIILSNFQDQMVFYITPTDALEKFAANPSKNRFRLGGLVLEGSVVQPASSPDMEFVITDLITDILVRYRGSLPDLFREGHSVVVEGIVRPFDDDSGRPRGEFFSTGKTVSEKARSASCYFAATEVLAKHDEKYMPKEVAAALERNKAKLEAGDSAAALEHAYRNGRLEEVKLRHLVAEDGNTVIAKDIRFICCYDLGFFGVLVQQCLVEQHFFHCICFLHGILVLSGFQTSLIV